MSTAQSLEAFKSYLRCQRVMSADEEIKRKKTAPFVTISRLSGAGGNTVADYLQKFLQENDKGCERPWTVLNKDLVKTVLSEHGLPEEMAKFLTEHKVSEIRDLVEEMCGLHPPMFLLVRKTCETLLHLAGMGNVILVGMGGSVVTRRLKGGLHVRLVGSVEKRAEHDAQYYRISLDEAYKRLKWDDQGRKDYLKQNFGMDADDPLLYDLTINTDYIPYQDAGELIGREVLKIRSRLNSI